MCTRKLIAFGGICRRSLQAGPYTGRVSHGKHTYQLAFSPKCVTSAPVSNVLNF